MESGCCLQKSSVSAESSQEINEKQHSYLIKLRQLHPSFALISDALKKHRQQLEHILPCLRVFTLSAMNEITWVHILRLPCGVSAKCARLLSFEVWCTFLGLQSDSQLDSSCSRLQAEECTQSAAQLQIICSCIVVLMQIFGLSVRSWRW
jgi:hypothetical protein